MKSINILFSMAFTAVFILVGCQKEQFKDVKEHQNYYASLESFGTATKTALADRRSVVWSSEDRIAVYGSNDNSYESKIKVYEILDSYVGSTDGEFTYVEDFQYDDTQYWTYYKRTLAFYPFSEGLSFKAFLYGAFEISGVSFPSVQKHSAGSFSDEAFPMVAVTSGNDFSFKNVGSLFKLSLKGSYSVSSITLTGNEGEPLSGNAVVRVESSGIPYVEVRMSDDASTSVTLVCEPAVQLCEETATDFYISIPPTDFYRGLMVTITDDEGREKIKKTDKININSVSRSEILNMPELSFNYDDSPSDDDRWVDLGLSVLWASYNLGADSPEEYGGFYAWGETETKSDYSRETYQHKEVYYPYPDNPEAWGTRPAYIGSEISGTEYDAAHVNWGDGARLPTQDEVIELCNCHYTSVTYNGITGTRVIGPNGNTIFLPLAGSMFYEEYLDEGYLGSYQTGTYYGRTDEREAGYNYTLFTYPGGGSRCSITAVTNGGSIRPVKDK